MKVAFDQWTQGRVVPTLGTNAGATRLPFQSWRHFKEAFAPELVAQAVRECQRPVGRCIDPFGGSGTTALACQFLGVEPVTIEVNPYLADLIEAKLHHYSSGALTRDYSRILRRVGEARLRHDLGHLPPTFVAPGYKERWVFSDGVAQRFASYSQAAAELSTPAHRMFFRALLGGFLVEVSNVVISGKGRKYRSKWEARQVTPEDVDELFQLRVERALGEIARYALRPVQTYTLLRGDCRTTLRNAPRADLAVFSPPYPNSFDYTDVYNLELWMLGYLEGSDSNRALRMATLSSHVQIKRPFAPKPTGSITLDHVSTALHASKESLWSRWIPAMVDGYFADMGQILKTLEKRLYARGEVWAVVGDSLYANVRIPVAKILSELGVAIGFEVVRTEAFRSMRSSAQQGWKPELEETLIVLRKKH